MQGLYITAQPIEATPEPRRKSKLLPLLIFLLVGAYGIMTMVLVEQGSVIQSQRYLIQQLFSDSQQLTTLKGQQNAQRAIEEKMAQQQPKTSQAVPQPDSTAKSCKSCKVQARKPSLEKQPSQGVDKADGRRLPVKL